MEIERKFLLQEIPSEITLPKTGIEITQLYILSQQTGEVRLRKTYDEETNITSYIQTAKSAGDLARAEVESEVSEQFYNLIIQNELYVGTILQKTRYKLQIPLNPQSGVAKTLELDIYANKFMGSNKLMLAEIEFDSTDEANSFVPPIWLQMEVTSNKDFKNKNLATTTDVKTLLKS